MTHSPLAPLFFLIGLLLRAPRTLHAHESNAHQDHLYQLCRDHPTWRNLPEDIDCSAVLNYDPDQFGVLEGVGDDWEFQGTNEVDEPEWMRTMYKCMEERAELHPDYPSEPLPPHHITSFYPSACDPLMATVQFVLSEKESQTLIDLKDCMHEHHSSLLEHRSFAYDGVDEDARGGNDVTFLAGFLQLFAPGVASQIYQVGHLVWKEAGWGNWEEEGNHPYPDPYQCGIRTTEHLSYENWSSLGTHDDGESLYTILVALRDATEYEGGEYYLEPSTWNGNDVGAKIVVKPSKLSAVVFLSEEQHGVQSIHSGMREMFTTELWQYRDVTVGNRRPTIAEYQQFTETGDWTIPDDEEREDYSDWEDDALNEEF